MFVRQPHDEKKSFRNDDQKSKGICFRCGNLNHVIGECPKPPRKDQKDFVSGSIPWSDSEEEEEEETKKDEICLMAYELYEVHSNSFYYSSYFIDDDSLQFEYIKLYEFSLKVINKNKL